MRIEAVKVLVRDLPFTRAAIHHYNKLRYRFCYSTHKHLFLLIFRKLCGSGPNMWDKYWSTTPTGQHIWDSSKSVPQMSRPPLVKGSTRKRLSKRPNRCPWSGRTTRNGRCWKRGKSISYSKKRRISRIRCTLYPSCRRWYLDEKVVPRRRLQFPFWRRSHRGIPHEESAVH